MQTKSTNKSLLRSLERQHWVKLTPLIILFRILFSLDESSFPLLQNSFSSEIALQNPMSLYDMWPFFFKTEFKTFLTVDGVKPTSPV